MTRRQGSSPRSSNTMPASPHTIRERGLLLVGRVNRWLIAGAVTLSGALSIVAAGAFHGHAKRSSTASAAGVVRTQSNGGGSTAGSTGGNTGGGSSSGGTGGLQPPTQAPAPSSSSGGGGGVVSGAS